MPSLIVVAADGTSRTIPAATGLSVMEVLRGQDLPVIGECNGSLACATCHVVVDPAWSDRLDGITEQEEDMLDTAFHVTATSRLSCQIIVRDELDGLTLRLPG